ncbi:DegV family protein [Mesotoga sp. UBA6090]|uniref:DegV family protein n=1 Tax=Mesotoga sp. UBA6090 TaxID=1946860 RepID=UPI0025D67D1B|nr:DegV family protein [Mesotoga sp. UBA6090]
MKDLIAISIDSGCAPTRDFIQSHKLFFMGMKVIIDDMEYNDEFDFMENVFYRIVDSSKEFHTAQPPLGQVLEYYNDIRSRGFTELLDIHFSSKMSGLYDTCILASKMVEGLEVHVVDTKKVSIGAHLVAKGLIELTESGLKIDDVMKRVPQVIDDTFMEFSVPTLKYLIKNGRIGRAQGLAGTLLNIKPILSVDEEGFISPIAKLRGMKKLQEEMVSNIVEFLEKRRRSITLYSIYGSEEYLGVMKETTERAIEAIEMNLGISRKEIELISGRIWPTIACHSGPAVFGLACYGEKEIE